ncbi:hypothetical protein [uncultured Pseudoflavonifractor sp.]|uniref:hypothetical protein n=1 Tax=Pseudoflavonifractor capillosus TaxID=106588 RepID=UPI0034507A0B
MKKGYAHSVATDDKPRYRAIVWSCPAHYYSNFTYWAQNCWGIKTLVDMECMLAYHHYDEHDKEKVLEDMARGYERMTMRSHSNGGYEQGREVKVVEMLPNFMEGVCTANRGHLLHYMEKAGVELYNCAKVTSFEPGKVHISRNVSKGAPNPYNTWQPLLPENIPNPLAPKLGPETREVTLDADLVVLAMGGRPDDAAYFEALAANAAPEIYNIGDSFAGGRVLEANRAAFRLAARV